MRSKRRVDDRQRRAKQLPPSRIARDRIVIGSKDSTKERAHIHAEINPTADGEEQELTTGLELVTLSNPFIAKEKPATAKKLAMTRDEMRRQVGIQEAALCKLTVAAWRRNWERFYGPPDDASEAEGRTDETQANRDREAAIAAERTNVTTQWMANNPGKSLDDARAFVEQLFTRNPGDKSYPFKYKSLDSNGVTYVNPVYGKTILHAADQVAGGGSETGGLGGARENFSIGAQWDRGGRANEMKGQLDAAIAAVASKMEAAEVDNLNLNVKLPVVDG